MDFTLCFTDKEITPWAGMGLMKQMLDHMGFAATLASPEVDLPLPGSNRAYTAAQLLTQFMLSAWCGAKRFEHSEVTRFDDVLGKLFGYERMANFKTIGRLFDRFDQAQNTRTSETSALACFEQIQPETGKATNYIIAVRQHIARRENAKGKPLSLFADMPEVKCWRYAAMCTNLDLPAEP